MSYRSSASTALSAPGKVLLTGGYLVLDRNYSGTVFALDARIHVIVQQVRNFRARDASSSESANRTASENEDTIAVRSPQFRNAIWEYGIERCQDGGGIRVNQKGNG